VRRRDGIYLQRKTFKQLTEAQQPRMLPPRSHRQKDHEVKMKIFTIGGSLTIRIAASLILIGIIGMADHYSGIELSWSLFYLIPLFIFSWHESQRYTWIIILSGVAAIVWYMTDVSAGHVYSHPWILIWNGLIRLVIFLTSSLLLARLRRQRFELQEKNCKLEELSELKNEFLGIAAHDLRNPVAKISLFSDFLLNQQSTDLTEKQRASITIIHNASQYMLTLLNDFLDIRSIEAGKISLSPKPEDYRKLLQENVHLNLILARQKDIEIQTELPNDLPLIMCDAIRINQVLNNLIDNAIKYSNRQTTITISVKVTANNIVTSISDQGRGIPSGLQHKLFSYFSKGNEPGTEGEKSTGLGLAIVKKIIAAHGGTITAANNPGCGSTFSFSIPLV